MSIEIFIWTMSIYTLVQYTFARYVAAQIFKIDPGYFELGGDEKGLPVGIRTSLNITGMIFDGDLPCVEHGERIKVLIHALRVIYAFTIPLAVALIIL